MTQKRPCFKKYKNKLGRYVQMAFVLDAQIPGRIIDGTYLLMCVSTLCSRHWNSVLLGTAQSRSASVRQGMLNSLATGASVGETAGGATVGTNVSAGTRVDTVVGASRGPYPRRCRVQRRHEARLSGGRGETGYEYRSRKY